MEPGSFAAAALIFGVVYGVARTIAKPLDKLSEMREEDAARQHRYPPLLIRPPRLSYRRAHDCREP